MLVFFFKFRILTKFSSHSPAHNRLLRCWSSKGSNSRAYFTASSYSSWQNMGTARLPACGLGTIPGKDPRPITSHSQPVFFRSRQEAKLSPADKTFTWLRPQLKTSNTMSLGQESQILPIRHVSPCCFINRN